VEENFSAVDFVKKFVVNLITSAALNYINFIEVKTKDISYEVHLKTTE